MSQKTINPVDQINSAIELINEARNNRELNIARDQANAFIQAAYENEDITLIQKHKFSKKARSAYRCQYIGA
nr:hypothetical protein [uncultured Acinetobacter sp.]